MTSDGAKPSLKLEINSQQSVDMPPPPTTDIIPSAATPSEKNPRPILKLSTSSRQSSFSGDLPTPSGEKKTIRIKVNSSQPNTPAATVPTPTVTKTKAGRSSKPTEKLIQSKKRPYESDDDDAPMSASRNLKIQKISLKKPSKSQPKQGFTPQTPNTSIKFRTKGELVKHFPGDAYDSEDSDREADPVRESLMILRTVPGPSTEYLRKALEDGTIGRSKTEGGANLEISWIDSKERRAVVTINGVMYAAVLVDLPTITEAMKTWDRKSMLKNGDVTQMLLCFAEVRNEIEAKQVALPPMVQKTDLKWLHGLTPPMHDCVNRRFRKGMSEKQLASAANKVRQLLADDADAFESTYEFIQDNDDVGFESDEEEDADGDEDEGYFNQNHGNQPIHEDDINIDLEAELEAELNDEFEMEMAGTPITQLEAQTPMTVEATTPAVGLGEASDAEEEEEISEEDDDDDDDDDEELDPEEQAKQSEIRETKRDLADLQKKLAELESSLLVAMNPLFKQRIQANINNCKKEIQLKKAKLNITDDE